MGFLCIYSLTSTLTFFIQAISFFYIRICFSLNIFYSLF
uniref:Uncharacterized protein n=1 Tax=Bacteriophage sp. TaxID=38018 RepID=A0A8D9PF38_9VIRU|nr:MAG TPA: hypothetical protein [Bacteriophage sp.]